MSWVKNSLVLAVSGIIGLCVDAALEAYDEVRSTLPSMPKSRHPSLPCRKNSPRVARRSSQNWKHSCRRGETRQIR